MTQDPERLRRQALSAENPDEEALLAYLQHHVRQNGQALAKLYEGTLTKAHREFHDLLSGKVEKDEHTRAFLSEVLKVRLVYERDFEEEPPRMHGPLAQFEGILYSAEGDVLLHNWISRALPLSDGGAFEREAERVTFKLSITCQQQNGIPRQRSQRLPAILPYVPDYRCAYLALQRKLPSPFTLRLDTTRPAGSRGIGWYLIDAPIPNEDLRDLLSEIFNYIDLPMGVRHRFNPGSTAIPEPEYKGSHNSP